jgi:hypothetical protein
MQNSMEMGGEHNNIDSNAISNWLDSHPEFLNDYLKKLKIQRRRSSIMNDDVLADLSTSHTTFKSQYSSSNVSTTIATTNNNNTTTTSRLAALEATMEENNLNLSKSLTNQLNNNVQYHQSLSLKSSLPFLFANNLNQSFSEPNILPPATDSFDADTSDVSGGGGGGVILYRNKFKNLSLYEKMYTLVKILYQSLDLKRTCKEILNTVSLLLDADRCSLFLVTDEDKKTDRESEK